MFYNTTAPTPTTTAKRSLQNFDFSSLEFTKEGLAPVRKSATWLLPQLMSFLGTTIEPQWVGGKISSTKTFQVLGSRLDNSEIVFDNGRVLHKQEFGKMIKLCTHPHSSHLFSERQTSEFGSRFSVAVPLVLSALKQYQNIQYQSWDFHDPNIQSFLTPHLLSMVLETQTPPELSQDFLVNLRGSNSESYSSCTVICKDKTNPDFFALPRLAKLQLAQVWVYHPRLRHPLQLGLGYSLDTPQPELISTDVFSNINLPQHSDLPWQ